MGCCWACSEARGNWLVKSNAEMGEGYSDITVQTPDRIGIVH